MGAILKPESLALFLIFSVPGIVALYFRAQFLAGRMPSVTNGAVIYITVSLAYHGLAYPLARPLYALGSFEGSIWVGWLTLIFVGPAGLGILLGLNVRKGWTKWLVNLLGLNTIHPVDCAWDWRFGHFPECWAIIVLKDGTKWYGYMGVDSFMSSDPAERDIYIERVYEFVEDGQPWKERNSSVWIGHGEIQSMEFLQR